MKRIGKQTSHVLQLGAQSPLVSVLGMGIGLAIFAAAPAWIRLPMVGLAGVLVAYRHTWN